MLPSAQSPVKERDSVASAKRAAEDNKAKRRRQKVEELPVHIRAFREARERELKVRMDIDMEAERKRVKEKKKKLKF